MANNTCSPITIATMSELKSPEEMEITNNQIRESQEIKPSQFFPIPLTWIIGNESISKY